MTVLVVNGIYIYTHYPKKEVHHVATSLNQLFEAGGKHRQGPDWSAQAPFSRLIWNIGMIT